MVQMGETRRSNAVGRGGAVACDQPAAAAAGARVLEEGGSAADAAVTVASVLNVTQPGSCGIGGDCWVMLWDEASKTVRCLDGTGCTPAAFTTARLAEMGFSGTKHPPFGHAVSVTVPGAVGAWCELHAKYGAGKHSLARLFRPAVDLARNGFVVSEQLGHHWQMTVKHFRDQMGYDFNPKLLNSNREAPRGGEVMRFPELAQNYEDIGNYGRDVFYNGHIAQRIVDCAQANGGLLSLADMAYYSPRWLEPLSVTYNSKSLGRPFRIWENPFNSQAVVTLEALKILEKLDLDLAKMHQLDYYHAVLEALKFGFDDLASMWEKAKFGVPPADAAQSMLADSNISKKAALYDLNRARNSSAPRSTGNDTTYFCVADKTGNACSVIYSNYMRFGTPWMPEGCGFALHNRGIQAFEYMQGNLSPCVRTFHTLSAGLITSESTEEFLGAFGCMGGQNQPQGHLQVLLNMLEFGMTPQSALNKARAQIRFNFPRRTNDVIMEDHMAAEDELSRGLAAKGHDVQQEQMIWTNSYGKGHALTRGSWWDAERQYCDDRSVFWAGCDPRSDGFPLVIP